ncbi:MAG: DNA methyltransferase [bacterium]
MKTPSEALSNSFADHLFSTQRELIPDIDDYYELELAFYENQILDEQALLQNGAYFAKVGDSITRHFLMCAGESLRLPGHSSSRLKSFFEKNIFRTGYATHGLFPYRGKFHPQMIKGIMNVMGLKPGDTVIDPMMGSGTVVVEASLMGIHSYGFDASPFCRFMAQTKLNALTMPLERVRKAVANADNVFEYFRKRGAPISGRKPTRTAHLHFGDEVMEEPVEYLAGNPQLPVGSDRETAEAYSFLLLAYLDAAGYSERSTRKLPIEQFRSILDRYLFVAEKIQAFLRKDHVTLGRAHVSQGDARSLPIGDESVDGILFSPPYSFAIDYLDNDAFHLNYLGVDIEKLQETMVGLRGKTLPEKFALYQEDMKCVVSECSRVLKRGKICTIIVGTNTNQIGKILRQPPNEVEGLNEMLVRIGQEKGMSLIRTMHRSIVGMSNTMRSEHILLLQKT